MLYPEVLERLERTPLHLDEGYGEGSAEAEVAGKNEIDQGLR